MGATGNVIMPGKAPLLAAIVALAVTSGVAQQPQPATQARGSTQRPARDTAQQTPDGTAIIGGRVLTADTGRPVKRARVTVAVGGRQSRSASTDDQGRFRLTGLPSGT